MVEHDDALLRAQLRHGSFQLQCFVDGCLNELLYLRFSECGQDTAPKPSWKSLRSRETNAVPFVRRTVQHLDARARHHSDQFALLPALIVMIAQNHDSRNSRTHYNVQQRFHLVRLAEVGEISSHYQHVCHITYAAQLIEQLVVLRSVEMQIGSRCNSHAVRVPRESSCRRRCRNSTNMSSKPHSLTSMANILLSIKLPRKRALSSGWKTAF